MFRPLTVADLLAPPTGRRPRTVEKVRVVGVGMSLSRVVTILRLPPRRHSSGSVDITRSGTSTLGRRRVSRTLAPVVPDPSLPVGLDDRYRSMR